MASEAALLLSWLWDFHFGIAQLYPIVSSSRYCVSYMRISNTKGHFPLAGRVSSSFGLSLEALLNLLII